MNGSDMSDWLVDNVEVVFTAYFEEFGHDESITSIWELPEDWLFEFFSKNFL